MVKGEDVNLGVKGGVLREEYSVNSSEHHYNKNFQKISLFIFVFLRRTYITTLMHLRFLATLAFLFRARCPLFTMLIPSSLPTSMLPQPP